MKAELKSPQDIAKMREGGEKLAFVLVELVKQTKPGISLLELEELALKLIHEVGGKPSFSRVPGYHWATCLTLNEEIVHGIPTKRIIKDGDVISIDIGMYYLGLNTDMSTTFVAGLSPVPAEVKKFLDTGEKTLELALKQIKPGNRVGHISQIIQDQIEAEGYSVIYSLTGHGIGKELHEYPPVPGVLTAALEQTALLKPGMTIAVEVIYAMGSPETTTDPNDGWTISTLDGKISAVFEKTIAVVSDGYLVLTPYKEQ